MAKKLGARGASVVGLAPATLQQVSVSTRGSLSNNTFTTSQGNDSTHSMLDGYGQGLTVPDYHIGSTSILYSPAQQSSVGVRNSGVRSSAQTQAVKRQSAMSLMSSFIPRFSTASPGPRTERQSIQQTVSSWFRLKPLPRLPVHPNMTIAAEGQHRKADEALPLPELVSRADELSGMLEKGHYPHTSVTTTSTSTRVLYGSHQNVPVVMETFSRDDGTIPGTTASFTGLITRRKREADDGGDRKQWSVALDSPKVKRLPMTKKQWMVTIGALLLVPLTLILGIGLGLGLKKKHKSADCPGNFTGNACNLG